MSGRPKGARNVETSQLVESPSCPACQSTERTRYRLVNSVDHGGIRSDGTEYTHVVSRRTSCRTCGKVRIDKFFENRRPPVDPGDVNEPEKK